MFYEVHILSCSVETEELCHQFCPMVHLNMSICNMKLLLKCAAPYAFSLTVKPMLSAPSCPQLLVLALAILRVEGQGRFERFGLVLGFICFLVLLPANLFNPV